MHLYRQHLLLATLTILLPLVESANHYCVNGQTLSIELDDFYHRDETIIPQVLDEPRHKLMKPKDCRWEVLLTSSNPDLQFVLEGLHSNGRSREIKDKFDSKNESASVVMDSRTRIVAGMFQVQPLNKSKHFFLTASWDPRTQKPQAENLRILLPLPRYCSRDMLSFNGSCYAVSAVKQNLTKAMSSIGGDAQLASFSSLAEITEFVAASKCDVH
uniref:CUB domain-containing protein n=1 Tax=Macrostomum lignano TaxID=282301 RepID=A0A1I8IAB5_9PLAT